MLEDGVWKRSSFGSDDGNQVRIKIKDGIVYISKDDWPITIQVNPNAWDDFLKGVKNGDFDTETA